MWKKFGHFSTLCVKERVNGIIAWCVFRTIKSSRPEVFCVKSALQNFAKFTGKHLCQNLFFNKIAGLRPVTLVTKKLWHRCFHINFAKFLRTPFLREHLRWLMFFKLTALKNFTYFTGKHLCWTLFLIKLPALQVETPTQVLFCKICEIIKNTFLTKQL